MTDLEISKTLALLIGWKEKDMCVEGAGHFSQYAGERQLRINFTADINDTMARHWQRVFDYRDWAVIGPIAERYGLLVNFKINCAWRGSESVGTIGTTPQKAIALAVIGAKK